MSTDEFNKRFIGLEITPTNNEAKIIIKVVRSLEKRGTLLRGTTRKINSQKLL